MEQVDPKFRPDTHWLLTNEVDSDPYWKWDRQPRRPNNFAGVEQEGFGNHCNCGRCPACVARRSGCACKCKSCKDCGMSVCRCKCSTVRRVVHTCGHHKGKLLMLLLLLVVLGFLAMNGEQLFK